MTTLQLKNRIIGRIKRIDDELMLSEVSEFIDSYIETDLIHLSEGHNGAIEEAISQIESGDYLTEDEANKEISEQIRKTFG
ncbi:MAG: hypothetical protein K9H64_05335 [Bacteroidales bacterium]|nr:hypothetical protein [Bacteroidales bacterium]MCF8455262.1 hypothetical protein [Bacteroidales bacterium]